MGCLACWLGATPAWHGMLCCHAIQGMPCNACNVAAIHIGDASNGFTVVRANDIHRTRAGISTPECACTVHSGAGSTEAERFGALPGRKRSLEHQGTQMLLLGPRPPLHAQWVCERIEIELGRLVGIFGGVGGVGV